jgi:hypothetical protein
VAGGTSAEYSPRKRDAFLTEFSGGPVPEPEEIRAQLERIRNSEVFVRSARIQKLLEYLVENVLAGQQERLKNRSSASRYSNVHRITNPKWTQSCASKCGASEASSANTICMRAKRIRF